MGYDDAESPIASLVGVIGRSREVSMDTRIRRNERCVINLPSCDYVFSSTRSCFIGFGFEESTLEMEIIKDVLRARSIEPIEASGALAPAQSAFCAKICSKIITSQFCIILLNNRVDNGRQVPNANVYMEYGLMLGFNKYIVPFQRQTHELPFNVAPLDTVKYSEASFKTKAEEAISQAIEATTQSTDVLDPQLAMDQVLGAFVLAKKAMLAPIKSENLQDMYNFGAPLGFNLLNDFSGKRFMYFGNFVTLRSETVLWRLHTLAEILDASSIAVQLPSPIMGRTTMRLGVDNVFPELEVWVVVASEEVKTEVGQALRNSGFQYKTQLYSAGDVRSELERIGSIHDYDRQHDGAAGDSPDVALEGNR